MMSSDTESVSPTTRQTIRAIEPGDTPTAPCSEVRTDWPGCGIEAGHWSGRATATSTTLGLRPGGSRALSQSTGVAKRFPPAFRQQWAC
jgi:hypothetical protein